MAQLYHIFFSCSPAYAARAAPASASSLRSHTVPVAVVHGQGSHWAAWASCLAPLPYAGCTESASSCELQSQCCAHVTCWCLTGMVLIKLGGTDTWCGGTWALHVPGGCLHCPLPTGLGSSAAGSSSASANPSPLIWFFFEFFHQIFIISSYTFADSLLTTLEFFILGLLMF